MRYPDLYPHESFAARRETAPAAGELVQVIAATAEICGQPMSLAAVRLLAADLSDLDAPMLHAALGRCRLELQGRLRVSDILARLDDGRPDAEAAWAMVPKDERTTVVWTEEMAEAWGMALPLLSEGDWSGAQAAFAQAYAKAVLLARAQRVPLRWMPSLGSDLAGRGLVLRAALARGQLTAEHVAQLLPDVQEAPEEACVPAASLH